MNKEDNIIRCQIKGTSEILLQKTMGRFMHQILTYIYLSTLLIGKPIFIDVYVTRQSCIVVMKKWILYCNCHKFIGKLLTAGNLYEYWINVPFIYMEQYLKH